LGFGKELPLEGPTMRKSKKKITSPRVDRKGLTGWKKGEGVSKSKSREKVIYCRVRGGMGLKIKKKGKNV